MDLLAQLQSRTEEVFEASGSPGGKDQDHRSLSSDEDHQEADAKGGGSDPADHHTPDGAPKTTLKTARDESREVRESPEDEFLPINNVIDWDEWNCTGSYFPPKKKSAKKRVSSAKKSSPKLKGGGGAGGGHARTNASTGIKVIKAKTCKKKEKREDEKA